MHRAPKRARRSEGTPSEAVGESAAGLLLGIANASFQHQHEPSPSPSPPPASDPPSGETDSDSEGEIALHALRAANMPTADPLACIPRYLHKPLGSHKGDARLRSSMDAGIAAKLSAVENYPTRCPELMDGLACRYTGSARTTRSVGGSLVPIGMGFVVLDCTEGEREHYLRFNNMLVTFYGGNWVQGRPSGFGVSFAVTRDSKGNQVNYKYAGTFKHGRADGVGTCDISYMNPNSKLARWRIVGTFQGRNLYGAGRLECHLRNEQCKHCPCGCGMTMPTVMPACQIESDHFVDGEIEGFAKKTFPCGRTVSGELKKSMPVGTWTAQGGALPLTIKGNCVGKYAVNFAGPIVVSDPHGLVLRTNIEQPRFNNTTLHITRYDGVRVDATIANGKIGRKVVVHEPIANGSATVLREVVRPAEQCDCLRCAHEVWGPAPPDLAYDRVLRGLPPCTNAARRE